MKTAKEIYEQKSKEGMDEFFAALDVWGAPGKLAAALLLAQRASDRLEKAKLSPQTDDQWLRYKRQQMNHAMHRIEENWSLPRRDVLVRLCHFKYGVRIKVRSQPAIRFRRVPGPALAPTRKEQAFLTPEPAPEVVLDWRGDDDNLPVIYALCERLTQHQADESATGMLFKWPAAK